MSTSNYILSDMIDIIRIRIRIQPEIWYRWYPSVSDTFSSLTIGHVCSYSQEKPTEPRPCLVHSENQKVFKIPRHIESYDTCMKH